MKRINLDYFWEEESSLCNEALNELGNVLSEVNNGKIDLMNDDYQRVIAGEPDYVKNYKHEGKIVTSIEILPEGDEFEGDVAYTTEDGEQHLLREETIHSILDICEHVNYYNCIMF